MKEIGEKQGWNHCQREHEELGPIDILTNKPSPGNIGQEKANE
jgi:hypothetical protein